VLARGRVVLNHVPIWVAAVGAIACVVLGAVLTFRPFTSVEVLVTLAGVVAIVTGVLNLASIEEGSPAHHGLLGVAWILFGVAILGPHHSRTHHGPQAHRCRRLPGSGG
jgi:uncharacterized membrane protein HdeD (DUF308 family)